MERKGFFIGEVLKSGWNMMKTHLGFFIVALLLVVIVPQIPYFIAGAFEHRLHPVAAFALYILYVVLTYIVTLGVIRVSLNMTAGQKGRFRDLFNQWHLFFSYLIANILYMLILLAGFILLVFPAFIWGARYALYGYFIVDRKAGPIEALKLSAKATMGAKWDLFAYYFVSFFLVIAGILCLIIGLFAVVPMLWIASALVYRKLLSQTPEISIH